MHDRALRQSFVDVLLQADCVPAKTFARSILEFQGNRRLCWGNLADEAVRFFTRTEDILVFWRALVLVGDARALLVFLDLFRERTEVLREVVESLSSLPATVQCAVVSMPEAEAFLSSEIELHPAARELLEATPQTRHMEHALHTARMRALRALRMGSSCPLDPPWALCLERDTQRLFFPKEPP